MTPFDDRKTNQKHSTIFMEVAADTLYQTRRNIFLEVLQSTYDKNINCKTYPYPHFNDRKIIHMHFSDNFKFSHSSKR